jgi:hypothetical protein
LPFPPPPMPMLLRRIEGKSGGDVSLVAERHLSTNCESPLALVNDPLGLATAPQAMPVREMANHRHKKIIKMAKGYRGRTNCFRVAVQRVERALRNAYKDRKVSDSP